MDSAYFGLKVTLLVFFSIYLAFSLYLFIIIVLLYCFDRLMILKATDILWGVLVFFMVFWTGFGGVLLGLSVILSDFCGLINPTGISNEFNQIFSGNTSKLMGICIEGSGNYSSMFQFNQIISDGKNVLDQLEGLKSYFLTSGVTLPVLQNILVNNISGFCDSSQREECGAPFQLNQSDPTNTLNQLQNLVSTCYTNDELRFQSGTCTRITSPVISTETALRASSAVYTSSCIPLQLITPTTTWTATSLARYGSTQVFLNSALVGISIQ